MTERPIIFSTEMVRAILEGRKTQTRRVIRPPQPPADYEPYNDLQILKMHYFCFGSHDRRRAEFHPCTYGWIGDRLWVRETFSYMPGDGIAYRASDPKMDGLPWLSPYHMPRALSRMTLEILSVKVEKLQWISEEDAEAEGISSYWHNVGPRSNPHMSWVAFPERDGGFPTARQAFEALWDSINDKRGFGWEVNPWVWVIEFKRVTGEEERISE